MGTLEDEIAWLNSREGGYFTLSNGDTWGVTRDRHDDAGRYDRRTALACTHAPSRRSWVETALRHHLAAEELKRDVNEGRINAESHRLDRSALRVAYSRKVVGCGSHRWERVRRRVGAMRAWRTEMEAYEYRAGERGL